MVIRRESKGFTLIELLIVLVIMVSVAGVVAPLVSRSMDSAKLNSGARELVTLLKHMRNRAVVEGRSITLIVDDEIRAYRTDTDKKIYAWPDGVEVAMKNKNIEKDPANNIAFYPDGSSSGGAVLIQNNRRQLNVEINWVTGRVSLNEV